ncbi:MAG: hypothetical protein H6Q93_1418, partial [Nitrospirae bacterium]|nr:hypothetical protein [Nitrospirota bacterium]
ACSMQRQQFRVDEGIGNSGFFEMVR